MSVVTLTTYTDKLVQEFPGLRASFDRFCHTCQQSLHVGEKDCNPNHNIKQLKPHEQQAETIFMMDHYS